jgi:hypothetical protein
MAFETGIDPDRDSLAGMAIRAAFGKRFVQNIPY